MADEEEPVIGGPYSLFDGSFILEFLRPKASRNASVLMRATYKHDHPWCKKGKGHPQSPPLHLHFQQFESFSVQTGEVGTTTSYTLIDKIHTPQNTTESHPHEIPPWLPHRFWPSPNATEDTTFLVWAHPNPEGMDDKMDRLFFQNLLMYVSDVAEKKEGLSVAQVFLTQHASQTALVMLPTLSFLGPLRWWIPLQLQALLAQVAKWQGRKVLLRKYMTKEEWEDEDVQERIGGKDRKKTA